MTESAEPSPPSSEPDVPASRLWGWNIWLSWAVILACVALITWSTLTPRARKYQASEEAAASGVRNPQLQVLSRYAVGASRLLPGMSAAATQPAGKNPADDLVRQVVDASQTPIDRLRVSAVVGELQGAPAALQQIQSINDSADPTPGVVKTDAERFTRIYTTGPESLSSQEQAELVARHDWFAKLALSHGKPDSEPSRKAVLDTAFSTAIVMVVVTTTGLIAAVLGLALLILAIVWLAKGRAWLAYSSQGVPPGVSPAPGILQPAYAPPAYAPPGAFLPPPAPGMTPIPQAAPPWPVMPVPSYPYPYAPMPWPPPRPRLPLLLGRLPEEPSPGTGPYLEGFAIYLAGQIGFGVLLSLLVKDQKIWMQFFAIVPVLIALFWPAWRGIPWERVKHSLGLHRGRGVLREIGAGFLGYIGGLPIMGLGVVLMLILSNLLDEKPQQHPIVDLIGKNLGTTLLLYGLACVWAPIVEETMFRGALFHHLRRRCHWVITALLVAVIFAAIHPYGVVHIPVLAALAFNFAAIREWRGSLIAPMTAHLMQNFMAMTMMTVLFS